ncbi:MAG: histidine kinase [Pseudoflavonifractor sp.]|nr:histidine kinase [Pseudoflavonifractor sp.]
MRKSQCILLILIILFCLGLSGCSERTDNGAVKASVGTLDLTKWDFENDEIISLDGQWEFYWEQLLSYEDLGQERADFYVEVPDSWTAYTFNGERLPGSGYATYHLHTQTSLLPGTRLALDLPALPSAYNVFINDVLIASVGQVGTSEADETADYTPETALFGIPSNEFDIIIQVSNFHHTTGGLWFGTSLGSQNAVFSLQKGEGEQEHFLLGVLMIVAFFNFAIFIMNKEFRYSLYLAFACLSFALLTDMVGEMAVLRVFPNMSFNQTISLWYSSIIWVILFLILYLRELFPSAYANVITKVYLLYFFIIQIIYIVTKPVVFGNLANITNYFELFWILNLVIIVIVGIKSGHRDGWINLGSMLIVFSTYAYDMLSITAVIQGNWLQVKIIGIFLFVLTQMVIEANRIRQFGAHANALELAFLQSQIKPHFLYNSLNTIASVSCYDVEKSRTILTNFSNYLRRSFDFKELSQFVPLSREVELVKAYIEIEKARFEERLEVTFDICDDLEFRVPVLMLQPIVENAVNHGILPKREGGHIHICIKRENRRLVFMVKDDGVGMTPESLNSILKHGPTNGVGLANIDTRLRKYYKKGMQISSSPGMGTEIRWYIPINDRDGE